jgi:hypothetical protein
MIDNLLQYVSVAGCTTTAQVRACGIGAKSTVQQRLNMLTEQGFLQQVGWLLKNSGRRQNLFALTKSGAHQIGLNQAHKITEPFLIKSVLRAEFMATHSAFKFELELDNRRSHFERSGKPWPFEKKGIVDGGYDALIYQDEDNKTKIALPVIGSSIPLSDSENISATIVARSIDKNRIERTLEKQTGSHSIEKNFEEWKAFFYDLDKTDPQREEIQKLMVELQKDKTKKKALIENKISLVYIDNYQVIAE